MRKAQHDGPQLFALQRICRVAHVTDGDPVPVENGSDAVYAHDGLGRRWVKKALVGANDLAAESIGWLLSEALRIPTPKGAACGNGADTVWLSEYVAHASHWEPSRAQSLKNPDDLGAILTLDAIIGNWDRHAGNLLLVPDDSADQLLVYSIDVAGAWIWTPSDIARRGLEPPPIDKLARGIPIDMIRAGAERTAEEAAKLDPRTLREYAMEACEIAGISRSDEIADALCHRCAHATHIVGAYLAKMEP